MCACAGRSLYACHGKALTLASHSRKFYDRSNPASTATNCSFGMAAIVSQSFPHTSETQNCSRCRVQTRARARFSG